MEHREQTRSQHASPRSTNAAPHAPPKSSPSSSPSRSSDRGFDARFLGGWPKCGTQFPLRHVQHLASLNDWPNKPKVIELARALIKGGTCAIIGKRGTGKTQAACWIASQLQLHGYVSRTYYFTAADLFGLIKSWYEIPSTEAAHNQRQLWTVPLLVIDEMQERVESEHEDKMLSHLVDKRYGLMQPTLMIANIQPSEMPTTFGSSVVSRLTEDGVVLVCDWPSFREQIRTKRKEVVP